MIARIEFWLNILHYFFYKVDYKLHLLSNKINPGLLLGKIPVFKKKFEEEGINQEEVVNKTWQNRQVGFGVMISGGGVTIILFLTIWTAFLGLNSLFNYPIAFSWMPFLVCMVLAYAICHFLIFQRDKYIYYFKKFDKWPRQKKRSYGLIALALTICVIVSFIYSFKFLNGTL